MKTKKRFLSLLMAVVLCMALTPQVGFSDTDTDISYRDADGTEQTCSSATKVTANDTEWSSGWYVVDSDVTASSRITVTGDVHLILKDNTTLTASSGINVSSSNSLTIYAQSTGSSMGTLKATSTSEEAGIGSGSGGHSGTITINGGTITATGASFGAGIGGGKNGNGGTITINGGTVTAAGGYAAAGIGGSWLASGGKITINGGTVTATGGTQAASIGGGMNASSGTITISGGTVTATGNIGCGSLITNATIYINDGIVFCSGIDTTYQNSWNGIVFDTTSGQVYGDVTLDSDFEIPSGYTLTIPANTTLTIPANVTLTNNGTIVNNGTLTVSGDLYVADTLTNNGTLAGSNTYYLLTVTGGKASSQTEGAVTTYNNNAYGKYGVSITATATVPDAKVFSNWAATGLENTSYTSNPLTFTMPGNTVALTANFADPTYTLSVTAQAFADTTYGDTQPAAKAITITSTGNSDATIKSVALSGTNASDFTLTEGKNTVTAGGSNTSYTIQPNVNLSAGTHTATITVTYNDGATATDDVSITVKPKTLTSADLEYTGSAITKEYDGTTKCDLTSVSVKSGSLVGSDTLTVSGTAVYDSADVSTATKVTFTPTAITTGNYRLAADQTLDINAAITKTGATVTTEPTAVSGLAYNGSAQALVNIGSTNDGMFCYRLKTGGSTYTDWSTAVPTATNAGSYEVQYYVKGDANHNNTDPQTINASISPSGTAPNAPSEISAPYTNTTLADVTLPDGWEWVDITAALEVGVPVTATAKYTAADAGNYATTEVSVTVTRSACTHPENMQEIRNAKAATAAEAGYTGDTYCTQCGEMIAKGIAIPATGKNAKISSTKAAGSKTGDDMQLFLWIILGTAAMAGAGSAMIFRRKRS